MPFFNDPSTTLINQINALASEISNTYQANLLDRSIKEKLKQYLGLRDYKIQASEISSLKKIYAILCVDREPLIGNKKTVITIVEQLLENNAKYSLAQVATILGELNRYHSLTLASIQEICRLIQNKCSAEDISLLTVLTQRDLKHHRSNDIDFNLLSYVLNVLNLPDDKRHMFYKLFCTTPKNVASLTDLGRLVRRLACHIPALSQLDQRVLHGFHAILDLFLEKGIFIQDKDNRSYLNKIIYKLTQCVTHIIGHSGTQADLGISDFKSFFKRLSEQGLISVENLYFIFKVDCFRSGIDHKMAVDGIRALIGDINALCDQGNLNQTTLNCLIVPHFEPSEPESARASISSDSPPPPYSEYDFRSHRLNP